MSLQQHQISILSQAIRAYSFPSVCFDFVKNVTDDKGNIKELERLIKRELTSNDCQRVRDGLSNVLYWGYAQMGIRHTRVSRFRNKVSNGQLVDAASLFSKSSPPSLLEIKKTGLPEFSGISFVSKIRMFLDPSNSAILDFQIMKMQPTCPDSVLSEIKLQQTQIPITAHNSEKYERWCKTLKGIGLRYLGEQSRAVDVERGLFHLIQAGKVQLASDILRNA